MTGPAREKYDVARKSFAIMGCAMLAGTALMKTTVLNRELSFSSGPAVKKKLGIKFELDTSDTWAMNLEGEETRRAIFNGNAKSSNHPESTTQVVFRSPSTGNSNAVARSSARIEIDGPYEWHYASSAKSKARKRLLIAQYSSTGQEVELYKITKIVNLEYANKWNHDIVFLNANDAKRASKINPSTLLATAWEHREQYDQVLILTADTMMNDFSNDITKLMVGHEMLLAKRAHGEEFIRTSNVFSGVTLWDLRHLLIPKVQSAWDDLWKSGGLKNGSEDYLKTALIPYDSEVITCTKEFNFQNNALVKYIEWRNNQDHNDRKNRLQSEAKRVCKHYRVACKAETYDPADYPPSKPAQTITRTREVKPKNKALRAAPSDKKSSTGKKPSSPGCDKRREPTWEWRKQVRDAKTKAGKRILVAQYSSYGKYSKLLELTTPINKAYASKWNHDFVTVQGATLIVDQDGDCEPPPQRAMYDKLELLRMALHNTDKYDQLLLMDADAMVYDLDFDISTLASKNDLLAAHRVSQKDPEPHTWDINNGIVLWNLKHPQTRAVTDEWYAQTKQAIIAGDAHGDQHYLQNVLKSGTRRKYVQGLPIEFFYQKGTVARHFIRTHATNEWNNTRIDAREVDIELTAKAICKKYPRDCRDLEKSIYVR